MSFIKNLKVINLLLVWIILNDKLNSLSGILITSAT